MIHLKRKHAKNHSHKRHVVFFKMTTIYSTRGFENKEVITHAHNVDRALAPCEIGLTANQFHLCI